MSKEFIEPVYEGIEKPPIIWAPRGRIPSPEKLIIQVAPTGEVITREQLPNIPYTPDEIVEDVAAAYKAGASIVHIHARNERGFGSGDPELYKRISELIKEECPDIILAYSACHGTDTVEERLKPLIELGLAECAIVNMSGLIIGPEVNYFSDEYIVSAAKYLTKKRVKPSFGCYTLRSIEKAKKMLIEPGIIKKPYWLDLCLGIHPPATPDKVGNLTHMVNQLPPDTMWSVITGDRNWLAVTIEGLLLEAPIVRVGLEDIIYMYPHSPDDDYVKSSADLVAKVVRIAKELGREVATPDESRKILGITR